MIKAKLSRPTIKKRSFDKQEVILGKRGLGGFYRLPPNTVKPLALGESVSFNIRIKCDHIIIVFNSIQ